MINLILFFESLPQLLKGALLSLEIALLSCLLGLVIGLILGILSSIKNRFLNFIITLYVTIVRGTPMLIQIFFMYYILPFLGIHLPPLWTAILAIGLNSAAYVSIMIRSGINSVSQGQLEAAKVLGFSRVQTIRFILFPQAIRLIFPALGNELITLIKDSSLASTIGGVYELTGQGKILISTRFDAITIYAAIACIYLLMTSLVSFGLYYFEQRLSAHAEH